jgi:hypothetical protein
MAKKPLTKKFLIKRGVCCGSGCQNCPYTPKHRKGSTELEVIKLLDEWLDDYEDGLIELGTSARKCYMNKDHEMMGITTWVHDDELKRYHVLRGLGKRVDRTVQKG